MRKIILAALAAATVLPGAAMAQSAAELHRDRQDIREDQRDLRHAYRHGDRQDVRDARGDLRDSRQEYREDWRDYRNAHPNVYARGQWNAPFRYQAWRPGVRLPARYYGGRYVIANPGYYRLPPARGYNRWVRHYDDVLLVNVRTGTVVDVIRGFYR